MDIFGTLVRLRAIEWEDLCLLAKWHNDPDIAHYLGGWSFPIGLAQQRIWFEQALSDKLTQRFIIEVLEDQEPIGMTGLWKIDWKNREAESGLLIGDGHRGKGYGTDTVFAVMRFGFEELGLNRLWAEIIAYNSPSLRVYIDKCGWTEEGVLRQKIFRDGVFNNVVVSAILRQEYTVSTKVRDWKEQLRK